MEMTVLIPTYEMQGKGVAMLYRCINSVWNQRQPVRILVTDDSENFAIRDFCIANEIDYIKNNGQKGAANNLNNGIEHASGLIKPLFQDDMCGDLTPFLEVKTWGFCTSKHTGGRADHVPYLNDDLKELALGCNTYGAPSAMAFFKNELRFDGNLKWLFHCEFYARFQRFFGFPELIKNTFVTIDEWEGSATNTVVNGHQRLKDTDLVNWKIKEGYI